MNFHECYGRDTDIIINIRHNFSFKGCKDKKNWLCTNSVPSLSTLYKSTNKSALFHHNSGRAKLPVHPTLRNVLGSPQLRLPSKGKFLCTGAACFVLPHVNKGNWNWARWLFALLLWCFHSPVEPFRKAFISIPLPPSRQGDVPGQGNCGSVHTGHGGVG